MRLVGGSIKLLHIDDYINLLAVLPIFWINTGSAGGASLPEIANGGQIDRRVLYRLLIYIMLSREGKYLKFFN
jgi:hypothetical protein